MFKKEILITQSYVLSKQEKKELAKILSKSYDAKHIDYIIKNFQNLSFHKISGSKKRVMFFDNNPIFFEFEMDLFYPTVYLLNLLPNLMQERKCFIYDETDGYLANGADLMLKGIINIADIKKNVKFKLNDIFCVETLSGTITMIGETQLSWNLMNPNNPSGKFLKSLHRIDDALWGLGSKKLPKKITVPELEKIIKSDPQAEKEQADKISAERAEAKKLINPELIELAIKIRLYSQFDFEKINSFLDLGEENKKAEKQEFKVNQKEMMYKANLVPVLDFLIKEKIEKEKSNKDLNDKNSDNEQEEFEEEENEDNYDESQEDEAENEENNEENIYLKEDNLEFALEKIKKFNAYYEFLESELNKLSESNLEIKENSAKDEAEIDTNKDKENKLLSAEGEKDEANKKVKQHKKKIKNKEKNENLINISALTSENPEAKDNAEKKEADEAESKKLQSDFLKLNFAFELEFENLKSLRNQLLKLSEFLIFALITIKAKNNANFFADPKFLPLLTSYKSILEEAEKIKSSEKANKEPFLESTGLNSNNNNEKEENEETEILLCKITLEEMDENINLVFFSVLKLAILQKKDEIFPLDPGKLLKDFLKPMANELEVLLDFRVSSHKKINNYLKNLAKNEDLIVFSKPKGMQNDYILSVNWQAEKIKNFLPPVKKANFILNKPAGKDDDRENVILNKDEKIELMQMFKPNGAIADIFKKYEKGHESSNFYQINKCNEVLTNYLKLNNLFCKGTGEIMINQELKEKIFKKSEKKVGEKIKMDELLIHWKKNLNEKDIITKISGESSEVFKTTKGNTTCKIKIMAKKLYNKNVTIVDGLNFFVDLKDITKTFSKHFACAVTVKPYQNSEQMVFIQGYWVNELMDILLNELKLGKNFIVVEDKLNLKKK